MKHEAPRRSFLRGALIAATWTAAAGGAARPATAGSRTDSLPPSTRFLDAVRKGDIEAVRGGLDRDPGLLHVRDAEGRTGYALALLGYHPPIAELLVERGYRPDLHEAALAVDWERFEELASATPGAVEQLHPVGGTAMLAAAMGGATEGIWRVYQYGGTPDPTARGTVNLSPLRAALDHPDLDVAERTASMLLGNGADPNAPQADGNSPLHVAAVRGSAALVEPLIRKGAAIDARDAENRTPADLAEAGGHDEVLRLLREPGSIPRDHSTSRTAFDADGNPYRSPDLSSFSVVERARIVGASHARIDDVRNAVERYPALAHSVSTTTESAVEAGAHMGRVDIVDLLLEHGAPYSLPTAVMRNDLPRARALLSEDPLRINERGAHDFPLLWYPILGGNRIEMAELLLERGARVEHQHVLGTTALHYAALGGDLQMIELLIERGADVNRAGRKFGGVPRTPLQIATGRGHEQAAALLRERGARG